MRLVKGFLLISHDEARRRESDSFKRGQVVGEKDSKRRIEELQKAVERKEKAANALDQELNEANIKIEVLEEERDNVRDVVKQRILNDDKESELEAKEELLDSKEERLIERENELDTNEGHKYKSGYADGLADGLRRVHEITAEDRKDAMKIAMVAASSHTPVANMKEINGAHQITSGTEDE